jgi:transposase
MKTMPDKTDRNDARMLAQIMRTGWFRQVHVDNRQSRRWRSLLVARRAVLNQMRSIENVVRAITREDGIKLGTPSRKEFAARVREMAGGEPELMAMIEPLLAVLASMIEELARLTRRVLDIVEHEKTCRRLPLRGLLALSLSGIGSKASWPSTASARSMR